MSFKDLTAKVAAAIKSKPAEKAKAPANANEPKTVSKEAPVESKKP